LKKKKIKKIIRKIKIKIKFERIWIEKKPSSDIGWSVVGENGPDKPNLEFYFTISVHFQLTCSDFNLISREN
jgi:hypothetical protein